MNLFVILWLYFGLGFCCGSISAIYWGIINGNRTLLIIGIITLIANIILYIFCIRRYRQNDKIEQELKNREREERIRQEQKEKEARESRILSSPVRNLDPLQFEEFTALYIKNRGYYQIDLTPVSGDFGADIIAYNPQGKKVCIQCKKYSSPVGVSAVQEILSAKLYYQCEIAMVAVTSAGYTRQAKELAKKAGVLLYTFDDVLHEFVSEDKQVMPLYKRNENTTSSSIHISSPSVLNAVSNANSQPKSTHSVSGMSNAQSNTNTLSNKLCDKTEHNEEVLFKETVSDVRCDKCGAMMVYKVGRKGKYLACSNFPTCLNTKDVIEKAEGVSCPICGSSIIKRYTDKRSFYGCERYPMCSFYSYDLPVKTKCPKCGGMMVQKKDSTGTYIQCRNSFCKMILRRVKKINQTQSK